jgi:transposase
VSLHREPLRPIPAETARVAHAAFPHGTRWMCLREQLGGIYDDALFAPLFSRRGQPAEAPWRLLLVSVLQFAEGSRTGRRPTQCARALIGSTCSAWS